MLLKGTFQSANLRLFFGTAKGFGGGIFVGWLNYLESVVGVGFLL